MEFHSLSNAVFGFALAITIFDNREKLENLAIFHLSISHVLIQKQRR